MRLACRRPVRFGQQQCRYCGTSITRNALGRAAHERSAECARGERVRNYDRDVRIRRMVGGLISFFRWVGQSVEANDA